MANLSPSQRRIEEIIVGLREAVDEELLRATRCKHGPELIASEALQYAILAKGHRWRPILFLTLIEACGASRGNFLRAAAGLEVIHGSTLIIDDLPFVDNAAVRRSQPACHIAFGVDIAVYASHLGFDLAESLILTDTPAGIRDEVLKELKQLKGKFVAGQCLERGLVSKSVPASLNSIKTQYVLKSGAFFRFVSELAGSMSGLEAGETERLGALGEEMGIAYQIADDIADISGEPEKIGKRTNMDAAKVNYPRCLGKATAVKMLENHRGNAIKIMEDLFELGTLTTNRETLAVILHELHKHY